MEAPSVQGLLWVFGHQSLFKHARLDTTMFTAGSAYNVYVPSLISRRQLLERRCRRPDALPCRNPRDRHPPRLPSPITSKIFFIAHRYKFGGTEVDRVTLLNVNCTVRNAAGKVVKGFGSMSLGNVWSFPSKTMSYDQTLKAMKALADRISKITNDYKESGHPIDINWALEPEYLKAAELLSKELKLDSPIPKLCTLVTGSPFDAAIHDAFGKLHNRNSFQACGPDLMNHDLSHYLGSEYKGEYLDKYILKQPKPAVRLLPFRRRVRPDHRGRYQEAPQRRPSRNFAGVDRLQRPDQLQDQAEWRRPEMGCRPCADGASGSRRDTATTRREEMGLLARFQREVPERSVLCWTSSARSRKSRPTVSTASSTSSNRQSAISNWTAET